MKLNWSLSTNAALTIALLTSATLSAKAENVDLHLDSLDADGHLSILDSGEYSTGVEAKSFDAETQGKLVAAADSHGGDYGAETQGKLVADSYSEVVATGSHAEYHGQLLAAADSKAKAKAADSKAKAKAADSHGGAHGSGSSDEGFLSKHTTEIEFTFAILVIVVGLIASEKFQRAQEQNQLVASEAGDNNFAIMEDEPDYHDLPKIG